MYNSLLVHTNTISHRFSNMYLYFVIRCPEYQTAGHCVEVGAGWGSVWESLPGRMCPPQPRQRQDAGGYQGEYIRHFHYVDITYTINVALSAPFMHQKKQVIPPSFPTSYCFICINCNTQQVILGSPAWNLFYILSPTPSSCLLSTLHHRMMGIMLRIKYVLFDNTSSRVNTLHFNLNPPYTEITSCGFRVRCLCRGQSAGLIHSSCYYRLVQTAVRDSGSNGGTLDFSL